MTLKLTRREFLKATAVFSAVAAAGYPLLNSADWVAAAGQEPIPTLSPTICGMCDVHCGVLAYTQGQKLLKLEGNYRHSHSLGKICPRGVAGAKLLDDPDRLRYPLKRVRDHFEKVSWDTALGEIGASLKDISKRNGPESLAWLRHPGPADAWDVQFMRAFGSPNIFATTSMGTSSRNAAAQVTLGGVPVFDFANSRYVLLFGRNLAESIFTADINQLTEAKQRGAHVVVFDPRLTNTAALAQEWIPIKPGTDGALLLALMNVLVTEKLYDVSFVERKTVGFSKLANFLMDKTPGWASHLTDVAADTIRRIAREMAAQKPACGVDPSWRGAWGGSYTNSFQTARAALCLNALLGSYGATGGLSFAAKVDLAPVPFPKVAPVAAKRVDGVGNGQFPYASPTEGVPQLLPQAILSGKPYPITAMIVNHSNPARSLPNTERTEQALRKLELLVVIDVQMSETAELAHYVLPESTFLERDDPLVISQRLAPEFALRQRVVGPLYDTRPGHAIITDIAKSAGLESAFGFTARQSIEAQIKPTGQTYSTLEKDGVWRDAAKSNGREMTFATASGKIELVADALTMAGLDPIPIYEAPQAQTGLHDFRLLTGHDFAHTGTSTQNNRYLAALSDENQLWIHTARAARLGIENDSRVVVKSKTGQVKVKAKLTEGIYPEAVWLAHGYGHASPHQKLSYGKGANDNFLIEDHAESVTGAAAMGETIVTVERG